jgi:Mn2+/Fe2+ NRAMP family transporter
MHDEKLNMNGIIKTLGPGILYAGAAIGASHLVQSTRAGANYRFELIWAVVLINLFKYPFFEFAYRYTAATGKNMLEGYRELGQWAIISFFILSVITAIINFAAVILVCSGLAAFFFNLQIDIIYISIVLLLAVLIMLFIGHYAILDWTLKGMVFILSITTIIAFTIAAFHGTHAGKGFLPPELWDTAGITFLIALMGWMPTPIEASVWPSLWTLERKKQTKYEPNYREQLFDFHVGYVGSAVMSLFFLGLGAFVLYGSGIHFSNSSVEFSGQLVSVYSKTFGSWSTPLMAAIALLTMITTAITVIDGYPRSLEASVIQISGKLKRFSEKLYWLWVLFLSIATVLIIGLFTSSMKLLLDFATIISFLAAPFFAYINFKVVKSKFTPQEYHPQKWLTLLGWLGMIFLVGFSILYLISRIIF